MENMCISDTPRQRAAHVTGRSGAQHLCEVLPKTGSQKGDQTQDQSGAQDLCSQFHGNG